MSRKKFRDKEPKDLCVGDFVRIPEHKRPFVVKARDERYIICTKPYNPKHTVIYFIIDLERNVRGTDDRVFCMGYETQEQCEERLENLRSGLSAVSYRNSVPLDVRCQGV